MNVQVCKNIISPVKRVKKNISTILWLVFFVDTSVQKLNIFLYLDLPALLLLWMKNLIRKQMQTHIKVNVTQWGSPVWLHFRIPEVQTASSPLGPDARSGEAKPGQRVSFTLLWGFVFTGGHAGTQCHVWIRLALFSNTSHSQLERPGWWFYSIFNILGQNLWQRRINSQDGAGYQMK